jgi:hypothetical protein
MTTPQHPQQPAKQPPPQRPKENDDDEGTAYEPGKAPGTPAQPEPGHSEQPGQHPGGSPQK